MGRLRARQLSMCWERDWANQVSFCKYLVRLFASQYYSLSVSLCVCLSLYLFFCVCMYVYLCVCVCMSISVCLSLFFSISHPHPHTFYVTLSPHPPHPTHPPSLTCTPLSVLTSQAVLSRNRS